eukprot:2975077-Rhodomonas_salina.2
MAGRQRRGRERSSAATAPEIPPKLSQTPENSVLGRGLDGDCVFSCVAFRSGEPGSSSNCESQPLISGQQTTSQTPRRSFMQAKKRGKGTREVATERHAEGVSQLGRDHLVAASYPTSVPDISQRVGS